MTAPFNGQALKAVNGEKPLLTIICPVFNEEEAVPLFYQRLISALEPVGDHYEFELLFTNNSSADRTLEVIGELRAQDPRVQVLSLSRNFGYQASLLAGLKQAKGDAIVIIDVDCEDPPEMIPMFLARWTDGYDIVYGIRGQRPEPSWLVGTRKLFYRVLRAAADNDVVLDMAEFSLFTSRVRDEIVQNTNTYPFLRAEIAYSGFKKVGIKYDRQQRVSGKSNYNLFGMTLFAAAGLLTVSTLPFRAACYLWPILAVLNLVVFLADTIFTLPALFKLLMVVDYLYLVGFLSIAGLYIARIYKNGIARPVYIIDWGNSLLNGGREGTGREAAHKIAAM